MMSNQKSLEKYLISEDGYLKKDISNGKVIMLSGKWGSGKTYFWKNIIEKELIENQTKKQKAYVYSSLYGNRTLDKIEDNIYAQAYLCSVGGKNAVLSGYEKVKDFGKRFGSFCSLLDVSKLVDGIDDIQQKNIKKSALSYLENGGIVCFDDFERKSKEIDLNDLFGFISHLAIDLNCKVVIILNDDVFEGEEKKSFSNVKEKSVSKFLKYEPSIRDLFKSIIFQKNSEEKFRYSILRKHLKIILKTIEETEELNARIYIQVLDNLVEWIGNEKETNDDVLRCLILVNINFILNHQIFDMNVIERNASWQEEGKSIDYKIKTQVEIPKELKQYLLENSFNNLKNKIQIKEKEMLKRNVNAIDNTTALIEFVDKNISLVKSYIFLFKYINNKNIDDETFQKINDFIETGILINE